MMFNVLTTWVINKGNWEKIKKYTLEENRCLFLLNDTHFLRGR